MKRIAVFILMASLTVTLILIGMSAVPPTVRAQTPPAGGGLEALKAEIDALQKQVDELKEKADSMLAPSQQDERKKLRDQIKVLERQIRIKSLDLKNKTKNQSLQQQDAIRTKYRQQIQAFEEQKAAARRSAINQFEKLLDESGGAQMNAGVMFRLATLYMEESRYEYGRRMELYDQQAERGVDPGETPKYDYSRSIGFFKNIVTTAPDYPNADAAYYYLAYCLMETDDTEEALKAYQTLIDKYPTSKYVPEAHVRMGEVYFERGETNRDAYAAAIQHYLQVKPESRFYDKALFKLGWTYYKMANERDVTPLETAVDYFYKTVKFYEERPPYRASEGDDLRRESLDYIAISFTDRRDEGIPVAQQFFAKNKTEKWNKEVLRKMAEVYFAADDYDNGRKATSLYLQKYPTDPKNPLVHMKVVESYEKEGDLDRAIAESETMTKLYGPDSQWAVSNKGAKVDIVKAEKTRMSNIYASATYHHERAQGATDPQIQKAEYSKAIASYEVFVREYSDSSNYNEAVFNLAEAYFYTEDYLKAVDAYRKVIALGPEDKNYKDSRFNVVKSYQSQLEKEGGLPNKEIREKITAKQSSKSDDSLSQQKIDVLPLSPTAKAYVDALLDYSPDAQPPKQPCDFLYEAARVQFWYGQFGEAMPLFEKILAQYPGTEAAKSAKFFALEGTKLQGNLREFQRIIEQHPSADPKSREQEIALASTAGLIMAGKLADEGRYEEAIASYMDAYNRHKNSNEAPIALHNTAVILETKLNRLADANAYLIKIAEEYPKNDKAPDDLFHAAVNNERLADFAGAQASYTRFSQIFPKHEKAKDALYNAALLALKEHDFSQGLSLARNYAANYPNSVDAAELLFLVAKTYELNDDKGSAEMAYREFTEKFKNDPGRLIESYSKLGKYAYDRGDSAGATKNFNIAVALYDQYGQAVPEAKGMAAQAKFYIAQPIWEKYQTIRFSGEAKTDANVMKAKSDSYKILKTYYEEVVAYGDYEWFTAGLCMLGMINSEFAEALFKAPIPPGLTPEQEDEYVIKLEDTAFPIKNKAIEAFEKNVEKANMERVHNKWIGLSAEMLVKYKSKIEANKFESPVLGSQPAFSSVNFILTPKSPPAATAPAQGGKK